MMYKSFWFWQKSGAAASGVDCSSDTARNEACSSDFPWNSKSASKLWAREKKSENEGGRVGVSLCLCYRQIPACRPTGTAPEKILKEARWDQNYSNSFTTTVVLLSRQQTSCLCRLTVEDTVQKISLCASLELCPGSHTSLLNTSCSGCAKSLHIGK